MDDLEIIETYALSFQKESMIMNVDEELELELTIANEEGLMQTGWVTINGQTFYLQPASDGTRGVMLVGWHKIDGRWYHFQTESDGNRGMLLN